MKRLLFDFDGVINSYVSGWTGVDSIIDEPVKGIKEALDILSEDFEIIIYSTRCLSEEGIKAIRKYMEKYNLKYDGISDKKVPAYLTIDDRAINFNGNIQEMLFKINTFKHYINK